MKITKLTFAALAGLLLATSAQAQVEINISGAVAFRSVAYKAIRNLFLTQGTLISQNPADSPTTPSELKVTWTGTLPSLYGAQTVTVRAFYNGAVAGVQDLVQDRNVAFLASATPGDTTLTSGVKANIAFSSTFQASTEFSDPVLDDAVFGATPIHFVKSTLGTAGITNITTHQFRTLAANGQVPAWFLTGNTNDTHTIYFINRDPTAGQRVVVTLESKFTGQPTSYNWNGSAFVPDPTGRNATQIGTILNTASNAISYLISEDSYNLVNSGQNILSYNGTKSFNGTFNNVSNDFTPLINGQYSLWVYEHLLIKAGQPPTADVPKYRTALISAIETELQTAPFSVAVGKLNVERDIDGAPVGPK